MKNIISTLLLTAVFILGASDVMAGNISERQVNQQIRIANGFASGQLTVAELARLKQGQVQLQKMKVRARADGVVTASERARLNAKADKESAKIYRNKHDKQVRF